MNTNNSFRLLDTLLALLYSQQCLISRDKKVFINLSFSVFISICLSFLLSHTHKHTHTHTHTHRINRQVLILQIKTPHTLLLYSQSILAPGTLSSLQYTWLSNSAFLHNSNTFIFDSFNSCTLKLMSKHTLGISTQREE